ncbi:DUF547 domain-containing protein [Segetibacter aerophilus]|uniref:DUF547 domain-containing protein n=1 Tax=Segetibacter aerophilus TaxID=670293 RepID=A0A512BB18_9BACT|nr:DUF547 domain-containing protein [Segetibacter aerophilus]GEO09151.1 hypothetical protein SAE01_16470 [Segetibacter aerophilus]
MKITAHIILLTLLIMRGLAGEKVDGKFQGVNIIETSQQLLLQAKTREPTDSLVKVIERITEGDLTSQLTNDTYKKTFWINIYNAFTQVILTKNPDKYKNRGSLFGDKQINIAGQKLSLDDIEHGVLRHSKVKWSLGYINKLFPSSFEKKQRVDSLDYRIHFSLNCGAKSCPPIAFYNPEQLDKQLNMATRVYLQGEAEYNEKENRVALPATMGWFRKDFGGKKKMLELLHQLEIIPKSKQPAIEFKKYNWNLFLENYKAE